jgi:hypothetical protein
MILTSVPAAIFVFQKLQGRSYLTGWPGVTAEREERDEQRTEGTSSVTSKTFRAPSDEDKEQKADRPPYQASLRINRVLGRVRQHPD